MTGTAPSPQFNCTTALLTAVQTAEADCLTVASDVSGETLMENAGRPVAQAIIEHWTLRPVLVLCGAGNNGGDGFVVVRRLGVMGDTGARVGTVPCILTVMCLHKKPGHVLQPDWRLCGETVVEDIGIPAWVLKQVVPNAGAQRLDGSGVYGRRVG